MICKDCGHDMTASCCVIGNYWDCSSCKTDPEWPKVTIEHGIEVSNYGPLSDPLIDKWEKELSAQEKHEALVEQIEGYITINEVLRTTDFPELLDNLPMNPIYLEERRQHQQTTTFTFKPDPNCSPGEIHIGNYSLINLAEPEPDRGIWDPSIDELVKEDE